MDRRTTLKWVLSAAASWPALRTAWAETSTSRAAEQHGVASGTGYGTDPRLVDVHARGEFWLLTLSAEQRQRCATLSDLIIPADAQSPAASSIGVVDFIDEWISAPYPRQQTDRTIVLEGLVWIEAEAMRRHARGLTALSPAELTALADDLCSEERATEQLKTGAHFFARYRDLTAGGFYSSPAGRKDLQYLGNVARVRDEPPPADVLAKLGLTTP